MDRASYAHVTQLSEPEPRGSDVYDVMQGVKVVEVAEHTFVPAAAMILADWGADVIKIERAAHGGDASRSMRIIQRPGLRSNPFFEAANRNKRGVGLDLTKPEGRELLYQLLDEADVFITNMRDDAKAKLGIEAETLMARNPRLIYASGTGFGTRGPLKEARGLRLPDVVVPLGLGVRADTARRQPAADAARLGGRPHGWRHALRRDLRSALSTREDRYGHRGRPRALHDGHVHHEPVAHQRVDGLEAGRAGAHPRGDARPDDEHVPHEGRALARAVPALRRVVGRLHAPHRACGVDHRRALSRPRRARRELRRDDQGARRDLRHARRSPSGRPSSPTSRACGPR